MHPRPSFHPYLSFREFSSPLTPLFIYAPEVLTTTILQFSVPALRESTTKRQLIELPVPSSATLGHQHDRIKIHVAASDTVLERLSLIEEISGS